MGTYYSQSCPVCGRMLQVRVQYLGRAISCRHCHGQFTASETSADPKSQQPMLARADELLQSNPAKVEG